jgi:hypothetical protein
MQQSRYLCDPETTTGILDTMAESGDRDALSEINNIDEVINRLLSHQIELVNRQDADTQTRRKESKGSGRDASSLAC